MFEKTTNDEVTAADSEAVLPPPLSSPATEGHFKIPLLPVVRIEQNRFSSVVTAIYRTHILRGQFSRNLELTEAMLNPTDDSALRAVLRSAQTLAFVEVTAVRESWNYRKLVATETVQPATHHFQFLCERGPGMFFTVPVKQVGNVRAALFSLLSDRYWQKQKTAFGKWLVVLIVFLVLMVTAGGIFWYLSGTLDPEKIAAVPTDNAPTMPRTAAASAMFLCLLGAWYAERKMRRAKPKWEPVGDPVRLAEPTATPAQALRPRQRQPLRSRTLGWALKLLGLAYWVLICSPLTDGLHDLFKNNQQGEHIVWLLLWAPAPWLIYNGYRMSARRYEPRANGDTRRPIVFLRPFEDDQGTSLQPVGTVAEIAGVRSRFQWNSFAKRQTDKGRFSMRDLWSNSHPVTLLRMMFNYGVGSSEESLVRYFGAFGPVIAIGKPGERLQSPGAARVYLDDSQWQESIAAELRRAQAVVVQPGLTEGVRWELEHLHQHVAPYRLLFCLVSFWNNPQAYEQLCVMVRQTMGITLPRSVPYHRQPVFVFFDAEWNPFVQPVSHRCPIVWPLTGDAIDLGYCLQPFVQGMHGGDREPPRQPRWVRGFAHRLAVCASVILGLSLTIATVVGVHYLSNLAFGETSISAAAITKQTEAAEEIAHSSLHVLEGNAVPYRCMVPVALVNKTPSNKLIEHERDSPDGRLSIRIIAYAEQEEMGNLAAQRLIANQDAAIAEVTTILNRVRRLPGADWTEVRLRIRFKNGALVTEYSQGTSGVQGTILVVIEVVNSPATEAVYGKIAENVLSSFELLSPKK